MRTPLEVAQIANSEQRACKIYCESWFSTSEVSHITFATKLTHFVSASTYYEVSFENVNRKYVTEPLPLRDYTKRYEVLPDYFVDEAPFGYDPELGNTGVTGDFFGAHSGTARDHSKLSSYALKGDLTSQVTKEHLVKTGVELTYYNLDLDYQNNWQAFGSVITVKERWEPYRFAAYVQDKIEAYGFIANLGLRIDVSNPNTDWVVAGTYDKYYTPAYNPTGIYPKEKAEVDVALSPRLGISHPITDNSKLYFNYGHFKQLPSYEQLFRISRSLSRDVTYYGNPNLEQAKTISYELGYDHVLFGNYLLQLAAFYHDITNQQDFTQYTSDRNQVNYKLVTNNSYADIRGVELTFRKSYGDWIRGFATYTYQVTTNGSFNRPHIDQSSSEQKLIDMRNPLGYQQRPLPQPRANTSITFLTPKDLGPRLGGIQPLGDWTVNAVAEWKAGPWINYNPKGVNTLGSIISNVQCKDFYNIDLRVNKAIDFKKFTVMLIMEVRNLLNSKFLSGKSFYSGSTTTGDEGDYLSSLHLPVSGEGAYDNIPGDDLVGEVRKEGVEFQPISVQTNVLALNPNDPNQAEWGVIYYDRNTKKYYEASTGSWLEVESGRMQKILDDKAYIDMPNASSFNYLNPRQIFFGISLSFKI
jgi:outer membrane receptor protein involved in Fe transport